MGVIYLDHLAATPLHPRVKEAMINYIETVFGNPSSDNQVGIPAAEALEQARGQVAALINAEPKEVVFNSGGTESVNHAIKGVAIGLREKGRHIITSNIEHKSVLNSLRTLRLLDYRVTSLDVDKYGLVDPAEVEKAITPETILISIMLANNEIGTIEPIADIAKIAKKHKVVMHTDAVAATGIIPVDVQELGVNLLSLAANQFYGPPGVGALYIRKGTPIWPLIDGGLQENKRRAGTENLIGIVGMGVAAEAARLEMPERLPRIQGSQRSPGQGPDRAHPRDQDQRPPQPVPAASLLGVGGIHRRREPGDDAGRGRHHRGHPVRLRLRVAPGFPRPHRHRPGPRPGPGHPGLHPGHRQHRGGHRQGDRGDAGHRPDPAGDVAPLQERAHRLRVISQVQVV